MFKIYEATDNFVYGKINLPDIISITQDIHAEVADIEFDSASIGAEQGDDTYPEIRASSIAWLTESHSALHKVAAVVSEVNYRFFKLDISDTPPEYQYTLYKDPNDHYDWHKDYYPEDAETIDYVRTLSLSLCLSPSDLYEGAELFVKDGSDSNVRIFKMKFGEFVIFPSTVEHRVNALRSGERASLVIWYGHNQ